jgi:hypothetical protein
MLTRKEIAAKVQRAPFAVELVKGDGYWYFTAEIMRDGKCVFWDSKSICIMYLHYLPDDQWLSHGNDFMDLCETEARERGLIQ